jgi:DNA-binding SARP family transcriptional activator/predicted ATPase
MLWPNLAREAALTNLRQVLHDLRQTLNAANPVTPLLQVERESIRLDPAAGLEIDAAEFSAPTPACSATPCPAYCAPCLSRMEILATRYRGEFMAGFSLPKCLEFEEWLLVQREALHLRALDRLARLSDCHERAGAYAKSLPFALRFLELEPWNEEGLWRAMRLFVLSGQHAAALAQYETCCRALKMELGVLPSEETQAQVARIRSGELPSAVNSVEDAVLPLPVAERRQVTVLYCELAPVGVEDPDEALALLHAPQARCSEIIRSYSGYLVQSHGGGLLAYFGYPQANENAARHAVQAALAVTRTAFAGLEVRAGIHTGMVISGGDLQVPDAIGATSELAIRLRQLADLGKVAVSGATQRLVAGYFECMSMGPRQLPGIARPLEVFKVGRERGARCRLEAAAKLTPLVGRKDEIATLLAVWQDARRSTRRIVLLRGEAGIGKSRLVLTLKDALREQAHVVRELRCFPEHSQSPFHPLTAMFGFTLAFSPDDTPETRFDKLAEYVEAHYPRTDRDTLPLLAKMLSLPLRAPYRASVSSPQQQREMTLALVLDRLYALAAQQPVLLVVEDLHWADPSTLELLKLFVTRERAAPILAVITARPEFQPSWQESLDRTLTLDALDDAETAALIAAVAPEIAPATVRRIVERADGIPLFAEELAKEVAVNDRSAIPATLQDLLAARLDGMGSARIAAQLAATVGREFSFDLLRRIVRFDETTLVQFLRQLQDAGLLWGETKGVFRFRHALIRDAAYQSQTRAEREAAHRRIAAALKTAGAEVRPEFLAQHWAAGGEIREAVACWIEAGKLACQHSASQEAVMHFKSGLTLIEAIPSGPEMVRMELDLQIGLAAAACAAQGYASAEGADAYARAMTLCGQHESGPDMFRSVWGLWASASSRAGYAGALELAQQLLRMASQSGDPVQAQQAHFAVADTLYWQGEFAAAREHLERVMALYQPAHHESHVAGFGEDAGVTSGSYTSWVLWFLGFPDQARQASAQTLALARQLGHPFSLAYALTFATILHCRLRQPEEALALAQETLSLASKHGFPLWQIGATLARGWALAMQNRCEGAESMRQCVEATRAAMGGVTLVVLEPLVDAYVVLGLLDAALNVNDEAFSIGSGLGDRHVEAELHRLKGESLLGLAETDEAEVTACFQQALAASRRQQAKSLELRATMSMVRQWQRQGKRDEARHLLEAVYNWFTEGFDTADLQDARKLLDSLAG